MVVFPAPPEVDPWMLFARLLEAWLNQPFPEDTAEFYARHQLWLDGCRARILLMELDASAQRNEWPNRHLIHLLLQKLTYSNAALCD